MKPRRKGQPRQSIEGVGELVDCWYDNHIWHRQCGTVWKKDDLYYVIVHAYRSGKIAIYIATDVFRMHCGAYTVNIDHILRQEYRQGNRKDYYKIIKNPLPALASLIL